MEKTLSVNAIEHGVSIDHIPAGQAIRLISLLGLVQHRNKITIGLNLQSKGQGLKDIIKIQNRNLSEQEQHEVAIIAPNATINFIENYKVIKKIKTSPPESIVGLVECPNPICITNQEPMNSHFYVKQTKDGVRLLCKFCEKSYAREEVKLSSNERKCHG